MRKRFRALAEKIRVKNLISSKNSVTRSVWKKPGPPVFIKTLWGLVQSQKLRPTVRTAILDRQPFPFDKVGVQQGDLEMDRSMVRHRIRRNAWDIDETNLPAQRVQIVAQRKHAIGLPRVPT